MTKQVTHILYSGLGGHGSVVFSLLKGDENKDIEHSLIFYGIEPMSSNYTQQLTQEFPDTDYQYIQKSKGIDLASYRKVWKALASFKTDYIMLHSMNLILIAWLYAKCQKATKLVSVEHTSNQIKNKLEWVWSRLSLSVSHHRIYLSELYKNEIFKKYGKIAQKANYSIIPNGIDTNYFIPKPDSPSMEQGPRLFMAGRFSEQRDHLTLLKAVKILNQAGIHAHLSLAGNGPNLEVCRDFIEQHHLEEYISLLGHVNEETICRELQNSNIYVQSSYGETMSTAIMQAMSCELPVIATDIPGIRNMIEKDKSGLFFEVENVDELVSCIQLLIENASLRERLIKYSRAYAVEHFSHIRMFKQYFQVISKL